MHLNARKTGGCLLWRWYGRGEAFGVRLQWKEKREGNCWGGRTRLTLVPPLCWVQLSLSFARSRALASWRHAALQWRNSRQGQPAWLRSLGNPCHAVPLNPSWLYQSCSIIHVPFLNEPPIPTLSSFQYPVSSSLTVLPFDLNREISYVCMQLYN